MEEPDFASTVGLFGTCGASRGREPLIERFSAEGIPFFNPQVAEGAWHPGLVALENEHLRKDGLVVFAVTEETTGQGSLAEIGFSILNAYRSNRSRCLVYLIAATCADPKASETQVAESLRSRALVSSKLADEARSNPYLYLARSLADLPDMVTDLWKAQEAMRAAAARWSRG